MNEDLLLELHKLLGGEEAIPYNQFKNDFNNDEELRGTLHQLIGGDSAITFNDFLGEAGFNPKPTTKKLKVSKINESTQIDWANETVNNIVRLDGTYEDDIVVDLPKVKTIKNEIGKLNKDLESDSKTGLLTTTKRPTPKSKTINGYSWDSGAPVTTTLAAGDYATTQSRDTSVFDRKTPEGVAEAEDRSAQKLQKEDELKTTIALSLQNQDLNSYIQDDVYEDFEGTVAGNGGDDRARYETMLDGADNVKEDIKYVVDYNTNRLNEKYDNYPQYLEDSQFVNTKEKQKQFFLKYADILSDPLTKEIYSLQDKFNEVDPFKAQIKAELFTDPEVKQLYEEKEKANKSREGLREGELTGVPAIDNTIDVLGRNFARLLGRTEQMVGGVASIFDTETGGKLIRRGEDVQELNPKSTKYEGLAEEYIVETDDFEIVFADDNPNSKPQYKRYKDSGLMAPTLGEVENSAVNLNGEIVPVSDIIKGAKRDKRSNLSVYTSMIADAAADLVPQILTTKGMGSALIKAGASTKMAYGLGAAFSGFAQVKGQAMDELLKIKDLTQDQREGISTALGLGTSVITTINPIEAKLASGELSTTIKNYIGKNAVNIANGNISPARIMYDIARAGAFGGIKEVGEESTEQIYEREVVKPIANKLYGASLKEGTTADEWKTLGIISFTVGAFADMAGNIKFDPKSTYQVQALTEVISNPDLYNAYMEGMSKTNPEQAAAITNTIKPIVDEISTLGDEVTTDKKVEIATKMLGAVKLEQDITKIKNPILKKQKEEALDNLYKEITNIELSATAKETPKPAKTFVGRDITDTKVFSDFDNTLYNPKTRELTPAGKELQDKLKSGEIKPEDVEILTARTADQAVPISKFFPGVKVNSDLSPEGKAAKVAESTKNTLFIDDNKDNLNAVRNTGKGEVIDSGTITPQVDNEIIKAEEEIPVQKTEPSTKREQAPVSEQPKTEAGSVGVGGDAETKQQIENFGVNKADVEPVHSVISQVFNGLKKAGLTAAKTVGDWVGIGKGEEKTYSLKINGKDTEVRSVSPEVVNGFYSPLEKIINESKQDKMPVKQWAEKYANSEEAKWTGLKDWLAQQRGSVSKADIQQYLKDNRIQVVEVVKGEVSNFTKDDIADVKINQHGAGNWVVKTKEDGTVEFPLDKADDKAEAIEYALEQLNYDNKSKRESKPKFQQYQLEGEKENYREVLVTLPIVSETAKSISEKYWEAAKARDEYKKQNAPRRQGEDIVAYIDRANAELKNDAKYQELTKNAEVLNKRMDDANKNQGAKFKSSHFDEPNILVHLRMNTRTDAEGKKVLFLEEIQSDWGQQGKKGGFANTEQISKLRDEETKLRDSVKKNKGKITADTPDDVYNKIRNENKLLEEQIYAIQTKITDLQSKSTPSAPFVSDTNAWTKLGLKVALKEAVKQGADKIAWTTGEQQNSRYDLSKSVDLITVGQQKNGDKYVSIDMKGQAGESILYYDENGKITENDGNTIPNTIGRNLSDVIGKEITEKILKANKGDEFKGEDLQIGGTGMKGFYGSPTEGNLGIVGNVAKSLFKQEPKTVELQTTSTGIERQNKVLNFRDWVQKNKNEDYSFKDAEKDISENSALYKEYNSNKQLQHSIDITPELKAKVEGGQPLFKNAEAQYRVESGKNIIEAIKDFDGSPRATVALTHEIMHPTVVAIIDGAKEGNEVGTKHTETIVSEFNKANPNSKVTTEDLIKGNDAFKDGTTSKQYRQVQEFIAKSWEKYHREGGKGFSEQFQKVLDQITQAFQSVYKSLTGKQLTPELRKMFDDILGKEQSLKETTKSGSVGVGGDVKLEMPTAEQQLKDINDENIVTFDYNNESEVPDIFKDKISSKGEINGKPYVKVTIAKSLADFNLQEQSSKEAPAATTEPTPAVSTTTVGQEVTIKDAPKGTHLNIGLLEERTNTEIPVEDVLAKLPKGVEVISQTKVGGTEPTVSVEISRPLTDSEMSQFLVDTKQQAIPQLSDGKGVLHDTKRGTKDGWGEFNPGEFVLQNGKKLGTDSSNKNDAPKTQGFFSNVVTGISAKYKPNKEWEPTISFTPGQSRFKRIYDQFKGKFDMHIATSIPTFRDTQIKVGNAISEMYKDGATMYDIGGSEGGFVKAITKYSKGKIKTFNLDPNPDMNAAHNKTPVKGSEIVPQAFYEGFEENGVSYPTHVPQKPVDVVHESMTFQFITPKRVQFVKEIKDKYLKPDGIFVTEEKLSTDPETYKANEKEKDRYKDQYYTKEQQSAKVDDVLVGMKDNQADVDEYRKVLEDNFKYVEQYWDAGNFKGFVASDSKEKIDEFISKVGKAEKVATAAPKKPTKAFTPVKVEDAKLKKSKTRGEDGIHDIIVNGETIGSMYFNQGDKTWRDPDYKEKDVHDIFGNIVGFNKGEAIKEVVDRYNKKQKDENKSKTKDGEKGQVGTTVGEKGSTQEEEKVAGGIGADVVELSNGNKLVLNKDRSVKAGKNFAFDENSYDVQNKDGNKIGNIHISDRGEYYQISNINLKNERTGLGTEIYETIIKQLDKPLISDKALSDKAKGLWDKLVKKGLAKKFKDTFELGGKTYTEDRYRTKVAGAENETSQNNPITEKEVETLLEPIGKNSKEREEQIYKFFALPAALGNTEKAREIAKVTNALWENIAKQLGKRSGLNASQWIKARVAMLGKTTVEDALARGGKFQVIGEKGAAALDAAQEASTRLDDLVVAKEMEAAGKDPKTIKMATGWEKGVDKKWRYEIQDDLEFNDEILSKIDKDGYLIINKLSDVFTFDELFTAFPKLKDIRVVITPSYTKKRDVGMMIATPSFDNKKTLFIYGDNFLQRKSGGTHSFNDIPGIRGKFMAYASHELQHLAANEEGFPRGGTPLDGRRRIEEDIQRLRGTEQGKALEDRYKEDPSGLEDEYYERIAGEVEAQNVEKRLGLTPEQRRQSLLEETEDVAREDQIIIQNSFDGLENAIDNGTVKLQAENNQTLPEAATNVANNLLTELDRIIKEMSNTANIKARGITTTEALKQKKDLQAVRAELLNNMKDPKWQEDAKFRGAAIEVAKGQFIIAALDSPDSSTAVHEFLHTFSPDLTAEEKQVFINEYNSAFGENETEFNRDIEEVAARMWEKYLSNGRQVTESEVSDPKRRGIIQEIFDKFTEYLQGIYNGIIEYTSKGKTREIKISPAVQALFDNIMGITPTATNTTTESGPVTPPAPVTTEKQALDNLKKAALDLFFGNTNVGIAFDPQNAGNLQADRFKAFVDSLVDYIKAKLDNGKYTRAMFNKDMADGKIGVVLEIDKAGVDYLFNKAKPIDPELDNRPTANVEEGDPRLDSDKHKVSGRFTNAGISEILEDFGSTGFGDPTSQSFVAAVNIANDMGYLSPGLESEELIRNGILEGKGVSEYESVAIMHALMKLHKQMTETRDMINKNEGGNVNHLLAHQEELLAAYELFALAHNRVGTQAGRTLVYRKLAEAYKFDAVLVKERIRKEFSDLGDEQVKTLLDIVDKIEQKTKELQELNANIEEARNKEEKRKGVEGFMSIKADKSKPKKDPVKSFKDFFSKNVAPSTVKFQGPSGGASPLDGYSEEEKMNVIKEFARHLVRQEGISSLYKLSVRIIEEYDAIKSPGSPSLSVDDIYKALALSSNSEKKAKITEYQRNINKIKSTASRFNKIATLLNGAIPTTNTQKPKPDDLKKLDDLINDLKKIFIMEDFGYTPSESSEIVDDLQKVMDALQAIRMTDDMADVNAQAQELRKIIGRVNAQMKINKLQQKLDDIRAGILPDTRVSSVNTIIDAKAFKLKEDIDEARAELKNKIFEARAWQSIMDSPMGKFEFKGFGKDGRFGFRGAVLKYNLQSIRKNWYEYTRRYVLGGDIGTLMLQGGYPTLMMLGKAPLQVLSQNGRRNLSYNYNTLKDFWRSSFSSFFKEFIHDKDSGKPNPSVSMYEEMMHTDNGVFAKQMGLALNRPFAAQLSKSTDEFFINKGLGDLKSDSSVGRDIISIFDKYEKISEGAYVTGVNTLRLNMFNSFRLMNPGATIDELKQYAEFVNTQTGTVPSSSTSGTISKLLLAPRLYWSRIQLITMAPFALKDLRTPEKRLVAKEKLKSLVGFGIGYSMVMLMMSLFGYDHEEDPRDRDFLKFKNGAKTIDVSAGMGKFVSLLLSIPSFIDMSYNKGLAGDWIAGDHIDMKKLINGEEGAINLKASKEVDLLDDFNQTTDMPWDKLINRIGFSMHPTIRGMYSMFQGEDAVGKPLGSSMSSRVWNFTIMNSAPLSTQDLFLSKNTILEYEADDIRKEESRLKDLWSEMAPQIIGINVNDAEDNMKHLFVEDHLNKIGYNPKTTFTSAQIRKLIPELAFTKKMDLNIDKKSIIATMRAEVYHSVGSLVLKNIQENNGIGTLSEDDIKDIFVIEGERIAEFYKDYYKDQLAVWRKEFEELERKEE